MKDDLMNDLLDVCNSIESGNHSIRNALRELTPEQTEYFKKFIGFWLDKTGRLDKKTGESIVGNHLKYDLY